MNKKLFSWKALAGLALLVAMGMTSCKNTTEVDPNDPYNTKTPTKPGTSTKDGDLTFTVTKSSDLVDLWNAYDATKKAELMKKTTLNIVVNSAGYKLDGGVITLPKFFKLTDNRYTKPICPSPWDNQSHPLGQLVPAPGTILKQY